MKEKLKPCPFCGGKPEIVPVPYEGWECRFRSCCSMISHDRLFKTKQVAIKAWNRRPK